MSAVREEFWGAQSKAQALLPGYYDGCEKHFQWLSDIMVEVETLFKRTDPDQTGSDDLDVTVPILLPQTPGMKSSRAVRHQTRIKKPSFGVVVNKKVRRSSNFDRTKTSTPKSSSSKNVVIVETSQDEDEDEDEENAKSKSSLKDATDDETALPQEKVVVQPTAARRTTRASKAPVPPSAARRTTRASKASVMSNPSPSASKGPTASKSSLSSNGSKASRLSVNSANESESSANEGEASAHESEILAHESEPQARESLARADTIEASSDENESSGKENDAPMSDVTESTEPPTDNLRKTRTSRSQQQQEQQQQQQAEMLSESDKGVEAEKSKVVHQSTRRTTRAQKAEDPPLIKVDPPIEEAHTSPVRSSRKRFLDENQSTPSKVLEERKLKLNAQSKKIESSPRKLARTIVEKQIEQNNSGSRQITDSAMSKYRSRVFAVVKSPLSKGLTPVNRATPSNLSNLRSFLPQKPVQQKPTQEELQQKKEDELREKEEKEMLALKRKEQIAQSKAEKAKILREIKEKKVAESKMALEKERQKLLETQAKRIEKHDLKQNRKMDSTKKMFAARDEDRKREDERRQKEEEERKRKEEENERKRKEEETERKKKERMLQDIEKKRRQEAEMKRRQEEERKRQEEARRKDEEAKKRKEVEERKRQEEESRKLNEPVVNLNETYTRTEDLNKTYEVESKSENLNSTYTMESSNSTSNSNNKDCYNMTPSRDELPPETLKDKDNYDIRDLKSDEDTDDEDQPRKEVPAWASGALFRSTLIKQSYHPPDVDLIFLVMDASPDLGEIFAHKRSRFNKRTSSAVWDSAPVTHKW